MPGSKPSILVVDDQDIIRLLFTQVLEDLGYACDTASDGLEAVRLIQKHGGYDIVFTDLIMPHMDGSALVEFIHKEHPETTIIICSIQDDDDAIENLFRNGASAYLVKPLIPEKIAEIMSGIEKSQVA